LKNLPKVTIVDKEKIRSKIQEFRNIPIKDKDTIDRSNSLEKDYNNIKVILQQQSKKVRPISWSLNHSINGDSPEYRPRKRSNQNPSPLNLSEGSPNSDGSDGKAEFKLPRINSANKKIKLPPICNLVKRSNVPSIPFI
jgi:hypothetical protein